MTTNTKTLTPAGDGDRRGRFPTDVARVRTALAVRHGICDDELTALLSGCWFTVIDALSGIDVPADHLATDLHDVAEVLAWVRTLLPDQEAPHD